MTTFNLWTNPRTGETRIYINDPELFSYGQKGFIRKEDNPICDWELVQYGEGMGRTTKETNESLILKELSDRTGKHENDIQWEDIETLTK